MQVWFIVLFSLLMVAIIASLIALFILDSQKQKKSSTPINIGPQGPIGETGFNGARGFQGFVGVQGIAGSGSGGVGDILLASPQDFTLTSIKLEDATSFNVGGTLQTTAVAGDTWLARSTDPLIPSPVTISAHVSLFMQNPANPQARFRVTLPFPLANVVNYVTSFVGYMYSRQPGTAGYPIFLVDAVPEVGSTTVLILSFIQTAQNIWDGNGSPPQLDAYFKISYLTLL